MKILLVAMPSVHFIRWIENLKDTKHELFWFDILDRKELKTSIKITKITGWKKRKIRYIKGEYFLLKKKPRIYKIIQPFLETSITKAFDSIVNEIKPDIVHSFEMHNCTYPVLDIMKKKPNIRWIYSCWGSDLFFFQKFESKLRNIKSVLSRVNSMHADCYRDYALAKKIGFKGEFLDVIPGGGGYHLDEIELFKKKLNSRKIILVKGYEHNFGRAINVLRAIQLLNLSSKYEIVVFGCHKKTIDYILDNNLPFKFYERNQLLHSELLELMGKSLIYIGNSISDGIPNTLLEAIILNVFPIQSSSGGATEEIINDGENGCIINNPEDVKDIYSKIKLALDLYIRDGFDNAMSINTKICVKKLSYFVNNKKILNIYN